MRNTSLGFNINNYRNKSQSPFISDNYSKLIKPKVADSGTDPKGSMTEFMNHDLIKPLIRPQIEAYKRDDSKFYQTNKEKWALGTTKRCIYKEYEANERKINENQGKYYERQSSEMKNKYKNSFLTSDNIAIRSNPYERNSLKPNNIQKYIKQERKFEDNSKANINNSYIINNQNSTINNKSGAEYNIINLNNDYISKKPFFNILDKKRANIRKGISEFSDLTRDFAPNFNWLYKAEYETNPNIFKKYNGVFTYLYDKSQRNGNMASPFGNRDNSKSRILDVKERFTMKNIQRKANYLMKLEMRKKI